MKRSAALALAALALSFAEPALAQFSSRDDAYESSYDPGKQKRRSDFTAGIALGPAIGSATGYPNEVAKIGDPKFEADTGFTGGNASSLWIGVALRDWMVFGVGIHSYTIQSSKCPVFTSASNAPADCTASLGGVFMLHVESYPLFYEAQALQNLGIFTEVGAGGRSIVRGQTTVAEGGAMAFVSLGVVYEPLRLGNHFSFGPLLQFSHEFSETLRADQLTLGFRGVYYGGPD